MEAFDTVPEGFDGIELRLDYLPVIDLDALRAALAKCPLPVILTLRKASHGGHFRGSEDSRQAQIAQLFALNPTYCDLEWDMDREFLQKIAQDHPEVKIICSYHNFEDTPTDLAHILSSMYFPVFYAYKLATMARSTLDALRMCVFIRQHFRRDQKLSGICMGEKGQITRILGPVCGNFIDYASVDELSSLAPGQLSIRELVDTYRYGQLNPHTLLYGLIGSSVSKSLSHYAHNAVMKAFQMNAVYVKMAIEPSELSEFFVLAQKLSFRGLSVTMPLKELVLPFLDEIEPAAKEMGSVNTLAFEATKLRGFNSDGGGALDAIEQHGAVKAKKVVILGAGGAAKAIAYVARQRGAEISVLNRTLSKAHALACQVGGSANALDNFHQLAAHGYDVLVNCTPEPLPIDPQHILAEAIVMDIKTWPQKGSLISHALRLGCRVVHGHEKLINQAVVQQEIWIKDPGLKSALTHIISKEVLAHILRAGA